MSACDERRIQGIKRVPVATLVEICGNEPGVPAFEAESLDVSGRGMHVKTAYVPNVGDPLICRFENRGHEIVAEGVVAWRREGQTGEPPRDQAPPIQGVGSIRAPLHRVPGPCA